MRKFRLLSTLVMVVGAGLAQGNALAGSDGIACNNLPVAATSQPQVAAEAAPVAATVQPTARSEREVSESGDRTRIVSYLILRGLQGAGPFLGR